MKNLTLVLIAWLQYNRKQQLGLETKTGGLGNFLPFSRYVISIRIVVSPLPVSIPSNKRHHLLRSTKTMMWLTFAFAICNTLQNLFTANVMSSVRVEREVSSNSLGYFEGVNSRSLYWY